MNAFYWKIGKIKCMVYMYIHCGDKIKKKSKKVKILLTSWGRGGITTGKGLRDNLWHADN